MRIIKLFLVLGLLSVVLYNCGGETDNQSVVRNRDELQEEIRSRELKRVTQAQITDASYRIGRMITDTLQQALAERMSRAITEHGLVDAGQYCNYNQLPPAAYLEQRYGANIRRLRLSGPVEESGLSELERQILDAYRYNQENNIPLDDNVQRSGADYLLYTAPLTVNATVCLQCHGTIAQTEADLYRQLQSRYAMDGLTGYSLNQPMGVLSARLLRRNVVLNIE